MKPLTNILIVDDEADMRHLIEMYLENSGFSCAQASNSLELFRLLEDREFDLILLDIMMPGEDGFQICRTLRSRRDTPIIFLTAKGEEWDKVKGLELGADDYIVKPFSPGEMVARIHAVLRRTSSKKGNEQLLKVGGLTINKRARKVFVLNQPVTLTLKEYELLVFFIENSGQALSREQLLEHVWGMEYNGSLRTVDTHVKTLRMKLGKADYIVTVWGIGYKFEVHADEVQATHPS